MTGSLPAVESATTLLLVDHLARHAAVNDKVRAGDEARTIAVEEPRNDLGDVLRLADPAGGMLSVILSAQCGIVLGFDPARADAVDADIRTETDCQSVGEGDDAAFCRRIRFGVWLGHECARRRNRYDRAFCLPQRLFGGPRQHTSSAVISRPTSPSCQSTSRVPRGNAPLSGMSTMQTRQPSARKW
jgi:hypothetical protein